MFYHLCFLAAHHELDGECQGLYLDSPVGWRVTVQSSTGEPPLSQAGGSLTVKANLADVAGVMWSAVTPQGLEPVCSLSGPES